MKHRYFDLEHAASISLMEGDEVWLVTGVEVNRKYRGQGAASKLLKEVIADADRTGTPLILAVEPDGTGLGFQALVEFYQRHGFTQRDQENTMVREPLRV